MALRVTKQRVPLRARVLVVEDNAADRFLIQMALTEATWVKEVFLVENAEAAVDFLMKRGEYRSSPTPDLIICDLILPGRDGNYVLETVKQNKSWMTIPLVMFSGSAEDDKISRAYSNAAEIYLRKPIELDGFFRMMENLGDFWHSHQSQPKRERRNRVRKILERSKTPTQPSRTSKFFSRLFYSQQDT